MKAIAIDDEPMALEVLKSHASKVPFLELTRTYSDAFKALEYLQKTRVDLIFLDIKMPDISGIDFFKSLNHKPMVIFTTAYSEHAVTSFELDAIDYLLKPFSLTRFIKACNKAYELYNLRKTETDIDSIFVKDGYDQTKVKFDDILFIEASGNYVSFELEEGLKVLARSTFKQIFDELPSSKFVQTHRSYAVAFSKIQKVERHQVTVKDTVIPLSGSYRENLMRLLDLG